MFITLVNRVATSHASFVIKPPAARDGDIVMLAPRAERPAPATDSSASTGVSVLIPGRMHASCVHQVQQ